jgi:hypothetical protein
MNFGMRKHRFSHPGSQYATGRRGRLTVILVAVVLLAYIYYARSLSADTPLANDDVIEPSAVGSTVDAHRTSSLVVNLQQQLHATELRAALTENSLASAMSKLKLRSKSTNQRNVGHATVDYSPQDADLDKATPKDKIAELITKKSNRDGVNERGEASDLQSVVAARYDVAVDTSDTHNKLPNYSSDFVHQGIKRRAYLRALTKAAGRVYCGIPSMYVETKLVRWGEILRTWGKRCDMIKFFVDPVFADDKVTKVHLPATFTDEMSGYSGDIVVVPMVRKSGNQCWLGGGVDENGVAKTIPCRHIWEKVFRMWSYVGEHDLNKAEWFLKVDDDTFFIPGAFASVFGLDKK